MPKATRNRALIKLDERISEAVQERAKLDTTINALCALKDDLVEAYTRKPSTRAPRTRAARASVKKTWDSATTNATKIDLAANAKARRLELDEANPDTSKM